MIYVRLFFIMQGQLTRLEERLATEVDLRQSAELSHKEAEAELRQLTATSQMVGTYLSVTSLQQFRCTYREHITHLLSSFVLCSFKRKLPSCPNR